MADCERTRSQTRAQTGTDIGDHVEEPTEAFVPDLGNPTPNSDFWVESNSHEIGAAGGEGSGAPKRLNFKFVEDRTVLLLEVEASEFFGPLEHGSKGKANISPLRAIKPESTPTTPNGAPTVAESAKRASPKGRVSRFEAKKYDKHNQAALPLPFPAL